MAFVDQITFSDRVDIKACQGLIYIIYIYSLQILIWFTKQIRDKILFAVHNLFVVVGYLFVTSRSFIPRLLHMHSLDRPQQIWIFIKKRSTLNMIAVIHDGLFPDFVALHWVIQTTLWGSHYLKLQWNLKRNSCIFIRENACENVVREMATILSRSQCVTQVAFFAAYFMTQVLSMCPWHKETIVNGGSALKYRLRCRWQTGFVEFFWVNIENMLAIHIVPRRH